MMGYPAGWVDGLSRPAQLKALGNAVVPQQGIAALSILAHAWAEECPPNGKAAACPPSDSYAPGGEGE